MFLNRCLLLLALLLSACATPADYAPAHLATPSPDTYTLALGNIQAMATLESIQATSQAISAELTATAYAPTQQAIEIATERAWTITGWTATAAIEQTVTSANGTATAAAWTATPNFTATVEAAQAAAQATALHGQAVSVELAIERERMMNEVQAVAPWAVLVVALTFTLFIAYRWSKVRPVQRDERGDAPLLIIDGKVYDADRNPYPLADLSGPKPQIPALTSPELQSATTARDQMIDLATRGSFSGPQRRSAARRLTNSQPAPHPGQPTLPPIEVVDAVEVREWIDEAEQKLLIDGGAE